MGFPSWAVQFDLFLEWVVENPQEIILNKQGTPNSSLLYWVGGLLHVESSPAGPSEGATNHTDVHRFTATVGLMTGAADLRRSFWDVQNWKLGSLIRKPCVLSISQL